jgi:hypothetical protein
METYQNLCTEFYDLDKPNAPEDALRFYLDYVEKAQGPILEPFCGSGRFLIPILECGHDVEGLDSSLYMLKACMKKCAARKLTPTLYSQYMQEMSLEKQYALIFIPSGSFGLITDTTQIKNCLKIFYDHLLPGGKFVVEIETLHAVPKNLGLWHGVMREKTDGAKILLSTLPNFDSETQILQTVGRYELIQNTQIMHTEVENLNVRLYQHEEFDNLLVDAGFKDIMRLKAYGHAESDDTDEVVVYDCTK